MDPYTYFLSFARLAPVQAVTWGHPDTTGIPNMDYFLSSELSEIDNAQLHYSEHLVKLRYPSTYFYPPKLPAKKFVRGDYGLPDGVTLYACPQTLFKFHPNFDAVLGNLLRRDPMGRLVLIDPGKDYRLKMILMDRFSKSFPDVVENVLFVSKMSQDKFFGLLILADALLDIPTFSGGVSSLEAFAMGAPIITWPDDFMRGRLTAAFYKQMGLTELIATDAESYVTLALRLARDADFRLRMQTDIKDNANKLFESLDAVRDIEIFFIAAYEAWRKGEGFANFDLPSG
jgi:predicted O-linked N-acetylglucosamine transferase (SPINDLY family)